MTCLIFLSATAFSFYRVLHKQQGCCAAPVMTCAVWNHRSRQWSHLWIFQPMSCWSIAGGCVTSVLAPLQRATATFWSCQDTIVNVHVSVCALMFQLKDKPSTNTAEWQVTFFFYVYMYLTRSPAKVLRMRWLWYVCNCATTVHWGYTAIYWGSVRMKSKCALCVRNSPLCIREFKYQRNVISFNDI